MADHVHPEPTGILRPSQAPRWVPCPGSFALEAMFPEDEESPEQRAGTAAHHYAAHALITGQRLEVGALAPNGEPITAEMVEGGDAYVDDILAEIAVRAGVNTAGSLYSFRVETKVTAHNLVHPENEGTPDAFLVDMEARVIFIWDYKFGFRYVDAFRNWQLIDYLAAIVEAYGLTEADLATWSIVFRVFQPRNYRPSGPVSEWKTMGAEAWALIGKVREAAHEAKRPGAWVQTGPQCRDCNGRHACAAFMRVAAAAMDMAYQNTPTVLPPQALGVELKRIETAIKRLEARRDGLAEIGMSLIRKGQTVPFWRLGHADTRERWEAPTAEVLAMGQIWGVELKKAPEPVTPAEARKRGVDPAVVAAYAIKPTGAAKLVPVDETAAAKAFGTKG